MLEEKKIVYMQWGHKKKFFRISAMLIQMFKSDEKMSGFFEIEVPFKSTELIFLW